MVLKILRRETEIILKNGCTIENIEYHLPEFNEPLARKIGISDVSQLNRFLSSLESEKPRQKSLENMYESVSGIHSHWISGPNKESLEKVVEELKKEGFLLGVNLNEEEIAEFAKKHGVTEVVLKPEIRITENHGIKDYNLIAEIILKHHCILNEIEFYLPGFNEPLTRKIGLSDEDQMQKFLTSLEHDSKRMESLEGLYNLSDNGIHTITISGPDTEHLSEIEKEFKKRRGFLLGTNLTRSEINQKITEFNERS